MTEQASRLAIDYRNMMASAVGDAHGVSDEMLDAIEPEVARQHARLVAEHDAGGQRWMDLPSDTGLAAEIDDFVAENRGRYDDFVLVGIGGSSLGAIATIQALTHPFRNLLPAAQRGGPRFFVLDNPDPEKVAATLNTVNLERTLVNGAEPTDLVPRHKSGGPPDPGIADECRRRWWSCAWIRTARPPNRSRA